MWWCGRNTLVSFFKKKQKAMQATVVQSGKVQSTGEAKPVRIDVFRYQKWVDGEGKLWIVMLTFGHFPSGRFGSMVELLDVDQESTIDIKRGDFELMVREGTLKRVEGPILI
ncbi:hypothetical protein LC612_41160 [Nostoc sp. CHAB 5834]|nr:hypothetical protein [Nostoc sp. CHAB 5834]